MDRPKDDAPPNERAIIGANGIDSAVVRAFFARLDNLNNEQAEANKEFAADKKDVFEEASAKLSIKAKVIRKEYARHRAAQMLERWTAELEVDERAALELLRTALGDDTPLGKWAGEQAEGGE